MPKHPVVAARLAAMLTFAAGALPAAGVHAAGIVLLPHHAVYKLSLASASGNKAPADASGMISYDFSGSACDGYKTVFQQVTELSPAEGEARVSNTETTTIESGNATTFGFDIRTKANQDENDVKGEASKAADGSVRIALQKPEATQVEVKTDALFPTEHLTRIIATAEAGTKILAAAVFDGSDTGRKIFNTLSVIGAPLSTPPAEQAAQVDALKNERRWPVTISYFDQGQVDSQPLYVLSFELYENGVSRALKVDYGNFALVGELVDIKTQSASACGQ